MAGAATIREIGPSEPVKDAEHVLIVKRDDGRFEVSGTAGTGPDAHYLTPAPFEDKDDALVCAQSFADEHSLAVIHVKGFRIEADA